MDRRGVKVGVGDWRVPWIVIAAGIGALVGLALGRIIGNGWVAIPVSLVVGLIMGDVTHHLVRGGGGGGGGRDADGE